MIKSECKVVRTPGGRRRIPESEIKHLLGEKREEGKIIGYARVSIYTQKDDIERQVDAIKRYAREFPNTVFVFEDLNKSKMFNNSKNFNQN